MLQPSSSSYISPPLYTFTHTHTHTHQSSPMDPNDIIAPFVLKTYHMVNDPSLDAFIRWGVANNSFIVVQPLDFSQCLLPTYFKHSNFSSFVRQLNTYGFRKVDPDRWEFANEWFLRGQTHLLKNIGRKKQIERRNFMRIDEDDGDGGGDDDHMAMEIERLKQDQKALEQELMGMNKRLEATERRPEQMMALLNKVAEDPEILPRMMIDQNQRRLVEKKRQRILIPPATSPSSRMKVKEEDGGMFGEFWRWSPSPPAGAPSVPWRQPTVVNGGGGFDMETETFAGVNRYGSVGGRDIEYSGGFSLEPEVGYPFSLLGGGF